MPVDRPSGRFLYNLVRTQGSRTVVEFGMSFGISTIHLAAAVRDNGSGRVITTELDAGKVRRATSHLAEAGLLDVVEIRHGDALETLRDLEGPVDLVFLDGWKVLYLPVLQLLEPQLRPGAAVVADDLVLFPDELADVSRIRPRPGARIHLGRGPDRRPLRAVGADAVSGPSRSAVRRPWVACPRLRGHGRQALHAHEDVGMPPIY